MVAEYYTRNIKKQRRMFSCTVRNGLELILGEYKSHFTASFRGLAVLYIIICVPSGHLDDMNVIRIWCSSK